jgi:HK97 family phage prohead protease
MTRSTLTRRRLLTATAPTITRLELLDSRVTAADASARTITGLVATWGAVGRTSAGPARFARGSITAPDLQRVKLMVEHDSGQVIGYATAAQETETGLVATFHVPAGPAGDAALASAAAGLRDGLSVGVEVESAAPGADGVLDVTAGAWRETSLVAIPAYQSARVTHVAAAGQGGIFQTMAQNTPAQPQGITQAPGGQMVAAQWAPVSPVPQVLTAAARAARRGDPELVVQAMADRISAAWRTGGDSAALRAALTDIIPPAAGATQDQRDAMFRPQWLGELWTTSYTERDLIDSISHAPLSSLKVQGFRVTRPAFGVATYAGNKTPVPSPGGYAVEPAEATARRVAGAHDVDRAFIDLGDGSFLASYFRYQAENYAVLTEAETATNLELDATALADAPATALEALDVLAQYFSRLGGGARMTFVAIGSDVWSELIGTKKIDAPWLYEGSAQLVGSTATVGGIRMFLQPSIPAGEILAGDRRAATHYEWKNPPLSVQAQNIGNGGIDLGVFGYHTELVNNPDALVKVTVTPAPPLADPASTRKTAAK